MRGMDGGRADSPSSVLVAQPKCSCACWAFKGPCRALHRCPCSSIAVNQHTVRFVGSWVMHVGLYVCKSSSDEMRLGCGRQFQPVVLIQCAIIWLCPCAWVLNGWAADCSRALSRCLPLLEMSHLCCIPCRLYGILGGA